VAEVIKGWNVADLSARLDALNICSRRSPARDLLRDPHVLPRRLVNNFNADGAAVPGSGIAGGMERRQYRRRLKVPVLAPTRSRSRRTR